MTKNLLSSFFERRHFLAVLLLLIALPHSLGAQSGKQGEPEDPLNTLKKGNEHFFKDEHFKQVRKKVYAKPHQEPYAIVLSCSDSRVPPEIVFGEGLSLGELFVIRVAGNVVDPTALGSIEYAAQILHAKLLLVLGHEKCGAVQAALGQTSAQYKPLPPNIAWFVAPIQLAVERTRGKPEIETIKENVRIQIQNVRNQSSIIRELEQKGFRIAGGVYNLSGAKSGVVDFF
jgi:carbonic anhydrase